jgi:hypothetical protein
MDIGPLSRAFTQRQRAELLELRTAFGTIYVWPSRWQRVRLGWAFRHFRVLPPQVLSPANQRLIGGLAKSAVVTPDLPVPAERIFGVIENVRYEPPAPVRRKVDRAPQPFEPRPQAAPKARPAADSGPIPIRPAAKTGFSFGRRARFTRDARSQQWGALAALAAICAIVVGMRFLFPVFSTPTPSRSTEPAQRARFTAPPTMLPALAEVSTSAVVPWAQPAPARIVLPGAAPVPVVMAEKSAPRPAAALPLLASAKAMHPANELETIAAVPSVSTPDRRFVSELPQGHFAEPVVTDPRLVGELRLRALIGSDGSVKEVTVVSGSPKLAEVGMRAVRRWRYQALDHPGDAETLIRMRFFGQDGVSIATLAK